MMPVAKNFRSNLVLGFLFILFFSLFAHFLYSWMGLNPTDDGFILAGSRRLLDGQVIHRDFIAIRPIGSYLLHIPEVAFGGNYTIWISRYVALFEFASIAWLSVILVERFLSFLLNTFLKIAYAGIAFMLSMHFFPLMVWHSTDALLLTLLGLYLIGYSNKYLKGLGYLLIGLSPLCRQNFLLILPAAFLLIDNSKNIRYVLIGLLPLFIYLIYLSLMGALPDALIQLTTQSDLYTSGVLSYTLNNFFIMIIFIPLGFVITQLQFGHAIISHSKKVKEIQKFIGVLLLDFSLLLCIVSMKSISETDSYIHIWSFIPFFISAGATTYIWFREPNNKKIALLGMTILLIAWSISISIGYNSPALANGLTAAFLLILSSFLCAKIDYRFFRFILYLLMILMFITSLFIFDDIHKNNIYREAKADQLTYPLDSVLPGAYKIKTDKYTSLYFADLQKAIKKTNGGTFTIVPDTAIYWVKSAQKNPFITDWSIYTEMANEKLLKRTEDYVLFNKGKMIYITQKVRADLLSMGFTLYPDNFLPILEYVHKNLQKINETDYFSLYR